MTLIECQGHPNWYQNVRVRKFYHTKFERNQSVNVQMQASDSFLFFFLQKEEGKGGEITHVEFFPFNTDQVK